MKWNKLYKMKTYKFKYKDSYNDLNSLRNKNLTSFETLKEARNSLQRYNPRSILLQVNSENSVESYFFTIVSDKKGHYVVDNRSIRRFHNINNCIKYKLAKIMTTKYSCERINYTCFEFNDLDKSTEEFDYVYDAYRHGTRLYI